MIGTVLEWKSVFWDLFKFYSLCMEHYKVALKFYTRPKLIIPEINLNKLIPRLPDFYLCMCMYKRRAYIILWEFVSTNEVPKILLFYDNHLRFVNLRFLFRPDKSIVVSQLKGPYTYAKNQLYSSAMISGHTESNNNCVFPYMHGHHYSNW